MLSTLSFIITIAVVVIAASVDILIHIHNDGWHRSITKFPVGTLNFWALGDRVLVEEDEFRSGYECSVCSGHGKVDCGDCAGIGIKINNKKCSSCEGTGKLVCPTCEGKGGLLIAPEISQRRPTSGRVVSCGRRVKYLNVGDSVLFSNFAGYVVDLDRAGSKVTLRVLHEPEILSGMSGHLMLTNLRSKTEIAQYTP